MRMAKNIPSNENQRPKTKTTLPSKALNQDRRPNKEFPRQKKSKRIWGNTGHGVFGAFFKGKLASKRTKEQETRLSDTVPV